MFNLARSGLSQKLTMMSALSTGSALLLVLVAFATTSAISRGEHERQQLSALAAVIGNSSKVLLRRNDREQAEQTLSALATHDDILQAALYGSNGKLLARYVSPALPANRLAPEATDAADDIPASRSERTGQPWSPAMRVYRALRKDDELTGIVMIESSQTRIWLDLLKNLGAATGAALLSFLITLLMAARFKASIAEPVGKLIAAAQQASRGQPAQRIAHQRDDELGALIDSVNDMLTQVEGRDNALAQYRDQLERQVSIRTEQLEKAKNAAEAASQAKSAFLATMSHEIRTPMNGVLGMTELLLASRLSEQQRHYTEMVKRSGEHLLVIINDILDFSKIEAGKLTVEYIHFNFRDLLDDIDNVFSPQAQAKNIRLELDIANNIPIGIVGDPNRLRQVIFNLLSNAIKFTDAGAITVNVIVAREDAQTVDLRFEVHDTGIGVSNEARARIFDSFSQADGSTTRKHGGTGLGLAISKQLVELMGGEIGVEHALTQGSVFWFVVNFDKRRVETDDSSNLTQGIQALIVDENPASSAALERQLTAWGIACTRASANDALPTLQHAAADCRAFDVALLDMELPRTSGLALAAAMHAEPQLSATRLLLLSTERNAADSVQRRAAGVAFQLIKPLRDCDLYDAITAPVRGREAATAAAIAPAAPPITEFSASSTPSPRARNRRKVLLAEDNPVNVEVASAMLEGLGLDVSRARNGEEALHSVQADDFDLVLMDCQMPVMDGFAATSEIRRREQQRGRARSLPIIAITANALQGDRESCLAAGMDDYLSKPFTQQALGQTLARWINLPRMATMPELPPPLPEAEDEHINQQALENIRALSPTNGDALLERVLHAFLTDTPGHLQTIRQAITDNHPLQLRKSAHSLKSSSANVGVNAMARRCKELEQLGRNNTTAGAAALLADTERSFQAARQALGAILEKET